MKSKVKWDASIARPLSQYRRYPSTWPREKNDYKEKNITMEQRPMVHDITDGLQSWQIVDKHMWCAIYSAVWWPPYWRVWRVPRDTDTHGRLFRSMRVERSGRLQIRYGLRVRRMWRSRTQHGPNGLPASAMDAQLITQLISICATPYVWIHNHSV